MLRPRGMAKLSAEIPSLDQCIHFSFFFKKKQHTLKLKRSYYYIYLSIAHIIFFLLSFSLSKKIKNSERYQMNLLNTFWQTNSRQLVDLSPHIDLPFSHYSLVISTFPACPFTEGEPHHFLLAASSSSFVAVMIVEEHIAEKCQRLSTFVALDFSFLFLKKVMK